MSNVSLEKGTTRPARSPGGDGQPDTMAARVRRQLSSRVASVVAIIIAIVWTIPTFGLFVSSLRPENEIKTTGWWKFFSSPSLTLDDYNEVVFGTSASSGRLASYFINSLAITVAGGAAVPGRLAGDGRVRAGGRELRGRDWIFIGVVHAADRAAADGARSRCCRSWATTPSWGGGFFAVWLAHTASACRSACSAAQLHVRAAEGPFEAARVDGARPGDDVPADRPAAGHAGAGLAARSSSSCGSGMTSGGAGVHVRSGHPPADGAARRAAARPGQRLAAADLRGVRLDGHPDHRVPVAAKVFRSRPDGPVESRGEFAGLVADAVIYQVYRARSPTPTATASVTCRASRARLDYLADLGVDALWLIAVLPLAAGRRRLRRRRLPRRRPGVRHAGRLRRAGRRGARPRPARSSSTSCPTTPPTSTRGSRRRWPPARESPSASATTSATAAARTASCRPTTGSRVFGGPAWTRVADGEWYLHLFDPRAARPELGQPRGARGVRATSCGSGWTAASTASASTSPTAWSRRRPARLDRRRRCRSPARVPSTGPRRCGTRTACTTSTVAGGGSWTPTPATGCWSARRGSRRPSGWPATSAPTSCTRRSTSTTCGPVGRRGPARSDHRRVARRRRAGRRARAPGCCPTTTWCGTRPASATSPATAPRAASASTTRSRTRRSACAGPGPPRC